MHKRFRASIEALIADLLTWLPHGVLAGVMVGTLTAISDVSPGGSVNPGKILEAVPGGTATALLAVPAIFGAAQKQIAKLVVDAMAQGAADLKSDIASQTEGGFDYVGDSLEDFSGYCSGLISAAVAAAASFESTVGQFLTETLGALKADALSSHEGAVANFESVINKINEAVQGIANATRALLESIGKNMSQLGGSAISGVAGAVAAVSGVVRDMEDAQADNLGLYRA